MSVRSKVRRMGRRIRKGGRLAKGLAEAKVLMACLGIPMAGIFGWVLAVSHLPVGVTGIAVEFGILFGLLALGFVIL